MSEKAGKWLKIGGGGLVAAGTILMVIAGADVSQATGIAGLAAGALAAIVLLVNGLRS